MKLSRAEAQEAVDWFVRQDGGALSATERAAFESWLKAPANARAYERVHEVWGDFEGAAETHREATRERPSGRWRQMSIAASFVAGLLLFLFGPELRLRALADYRTSTAEIRTVTLPDGSKMSLNADSAVAIAFTPAARTVRLLEGEARFEVAPQPERPFIVEAASGATRALGTVFTVQKLDSGARVTGVEHRVQVTCCSSGSVSIGAGEQVTYHSTSGLSDVRPEPGVSDAWLRGRLIVENRPLAEVVEELNRYTHRRIQVLGPGLGELRVNGVFPLADPDRSLAALEQSLGLESIRVTRYLVLLTR